MGLKIRSLSALLMLVLLLSVTNAFSQTQATTGLLQGTVEDPAGAVVSGATVVVKNTETNATRQLTTDSDGRFVFLALPPGPYVLNVTGKGGFSELEHSAVAVKV